MKICTTCGANLADDTDVCPNDGTPLFARAAAVATTTGHGRRFADDDEATMAVDVGAVLASYRNEQRAHPPSQDSSSVVVNVNVNVGAVRASHRNAQSARPVESDEEEATMAVDIGAVLKRDVRKGGRREESTLAVDFLPDSLMEASRGDDGPARRSAKPDDDPMAALAAAGLLKAATPSVRPGTPSVQSGFRSSTPPLDEPTIQMGEGDRQEFQALARQLINQGGESSMAARQGPRTARPAPSAARSWPESQVDDPDEGMVVDLGSDISSDDEDFVDFDEDGADVEANANADNDGVEVDDEESEDVLNLGGEDQEADDEKSLKVPMPTERETGNLGLSSLINETLAEEGVDLDHLPRAAPLAFGAYGVMTSPEQDAALLDLPAPRKHRRVQQATSRVLIGLLILVVLLGATIGVYYYLLPELGLESPYIVPYLDDYFAP